MINKDTIMDNDTMDDNDTIMDDNDIVIIELDAFNFGYSETEIRVKEGDLVRIVLTSTDGNHNFVIDELDIETEVIGTDENTIIEFVATEAGTYDFYCSVGNHRTLGMEGVLIIE